MSDYARFTYDDALEMKAAGLVAASADGDILDLSRRHAVRGFIDGGLTCPLCRHQGLFLETQHGAGSR